ncbi:MAG: tetratricopeptide repeat protein [Chloroflexota bacterium]
MRLSILLLAGGGTLALAGCASSPSANSATATAPAGTAVASKVTPSPLKTKVAPAPKASFTPLPVHATGTAYQKGQAYLRTRHWSQALASFHTSIAHHQQVAASYAGIGEVEIGQGNFAASEKAYSNAAKNQPNHAVYLYDAAYAALYNHDYHVAVSEATAYIKQKPKQAAGYHLRFLAYGDLLNRKKQLADAATITRLQPSDAGAWNDLGIAQANDKHPQKSIKAFGQAVRLSPRNPSYYMNRGLVQEELLKNPKAALPDYEEARKLTTNKSSLQTLNKAIAALKGQIKH